MAVNLFGQAPVWEYTEQTDVLKSPTKPIETFSLRGRFIQKPLVELDSRQLLVVMCQDGLYGTSLLYPGTVVYSIASTNSVPVVLRWDDLPEPVSVNWGAVPNSKAVRFNYETLSLLLTGDRKSNLLKTT